MARLDEFGELMPRVAVCRYCAIGLHEECIFGKHSDDADALEFICCCQTENRDPSGPADSGAERTVGGQVSQDPKDLKDVVSAGRKRAAFLYQIHPGMVCQWSGLLFAGGGVEPITGCNGNLIFPPKKTEAHSGQDPLSGNIHHGPDKSTLSNMESNISLICLSCHHTWHGRNDRYYDRRRPDHGAPWLPKGEWSPKDDTTRATIETLEATASGRESKNPRTSDPFRRGVVPEDEWITA